MQIVTRGFVENMIFLKRWTLVLVIYSNERPLLKDFEYFEDYAKAVLAIKSSCWEYEKEWRSIQILPFRECSNKMYPVINVKNCITAIYLGCNMLEEHQLEIARSYVGTDVKVYGVNMRECYNIQSTWIIVFLKNWLMVGKKICIDIVEYR